MTEPFSFAPPPLGAVQIVETALAVQTTEDWSRVRSPGRARRRRRAGHRQNIDIVRKPTSHLVGSTLYAHPEIVRQLRERIPERQP